MWTNFMLIFRHEILLQIYDFFFFFFSWRFSVSTSYKKYKIFFDFSQKLENVHYLDNFRIKSYLIFTFVSIVSIFSCKPVINFTGSKSCDESNPRAVLTARHCSMAPLYPFGWAWVISAHCLAAF